MRDVVPTVQHAAPRWQHDLVVGDQEGAAGQPQPSRRQGWCGPPTPAHRGLCYLVFEDLPLADFGNRIPNITAELTFKSTGAQPWLLADLIEPAEGGAFPASQTSGLAVDWRRGRLTVFGQSVEYE